jgi:hypothetical protein
MHTAFMTIHLDTDLQSIEINEEMTMCSFDIENMYTNMPKSDTINVMDNILKTSRKVVETNQKGMIHILQTVTEQNYIQFNEQYYK